MKHRFLVSTAVLLASATLASGQELPRSTSDHQHQQQAALEIDADDIRQVQSLLFDQGYGVVVDGILGPQTKSALLQYQLRHGLSATGRIDKATLSEFGIAIDPSDEPSTTGQGGARPDSSRAR